MNKFIITEEEKNRILGMHQDHGYNSLNEQSITEVTAGEMEASGARYNDNVANNVKNMALVKPKSPKFPCVYYAPKDGDTEGHYAPAKMDFVRLFFPNLITVYWENKTIKQYERKGNAAGAETKKGTWKCKSDNSDADVVWANNTLAKPAKQALKPTGQSTPNTNESSIGVNYQYNYEGDTKYVYGVKDGKWFGKNLANGKEFDLSNIKTTVTNLNNQFPNALTQLETPVDSNPAVTTTTTTTNVVPKKLTDMKQIELQIMNKNQNLAFRSAYDKLGAIEKKQVDNTLAGKL